MTNTGFFVGAAKSLLSALKESGNAHKLSPELTKKLEALGHKKVMLLNTGPAHKTLGMSRESLATFRMPVAQASQTELVRGGTLQASLPREDDTGMSRILLNDQLKLVEFLTPDERSSVFAGEGKMFKLPDSNGEVVLHLAEHRAIQDYMSVPDHSKMVNAFLRGEPGQAQGHWNNKNLTDFSLLLISGLNALPNSPGFAMHTLPEDSPMFRAMLAAAETGQPFTPDYFLSTTAISDEQAADRHTPPNSSLGDTAVLVKTNLGKNVADINTMHDQESEKIIAPFASFDVKVTNESNSNKPALELTERSKLDQPKH